MQILEEYKVILLVDELFNYKIRNSFAQWRKCGLLPSAFRSLFPPAFTGGKGSLQNPGEFNLSSYGCFLLGLFTHTEIKYLNHEELHIMHTVSSEL